MKVFSIERFEKIRRLTRDNPRMSSYFIGLVLMLFTYFTVGIFSPYVDTNAARQTETITTGNYTISMSSEEDVAIQLTSSTSAGKTFTATNTIGVTNTCAYGATVKMTTDKNNNSLNRSDGRSETIPATSSSTSLTTNSWGYSIDGGSTYKAVPALNGTPVTIYNGTTSQDINVIYGVNVNNTVVAGAYTTGTVFSLTPSPDCANYPITWNFNGGSGKSGATYPSSAALGSTINLSTLKPTKTNYVFAGWKTSASREFLGTETAADINPTSANAITMTAQWVATGGRDIPPGEEIIPVPVENTGYYKLEAWGAQGGTYSSTAGGKGGYSVGTYYGTKGQTFYVGVGGAGGTSGTAGYNGGGSGSSSYTGGGGATHIALSGGLLKNVSPSNLLLVAGGGGGSGISQSTTTNYSGTSNWTLEYVDRTAHQTSSPASGTASWHLLYDKKVSKTVYNTGTTSWSVTYPNTTKDPDREVTRTLNIGTHMKANSWWGVWPTEWGPAVQDENGNISISMPLISCNNVGLWSSYYIQCYGLRRSGTVTVTMTSGTGTSSKTCINVDGVQDCTKGKNVTKSKSVSAGQSVEVELYNSATGKDPVGTISYPDLEEGATHVGTASDSGSHSPTGDTVVKTFTVNTAGTVTFTSTHTGTIDPTCHIRVNSSTPVFDDDSAGNRDFKCEATVNAGDTVTLTSGIVSPYETVYENETQEETGSTTASSRLGTLVKTLSANTDGSFTFESTSYSRDPYCTVIIKDSGGNVLSSVTNDDGPSSEGYGRNYKCTGSYSNGNIVEFYSGLYNDTDTTTYYTDDQKTTSGSTTATTEYGELAASITPSTSGTFSFYSTSYTRDPECNVKIKNSSGTVIQNINDDDGGEGVNYKCTGSYESGYTIEFYSGLHTASSTSTYAAASGGAGGGSSGVSVTGATTGGTQSSGYAFGQGGSSSSGAGGGGGYYGGYGSSHAGGGSGGSGYVNTSLLTNSPATYAGNTSFTSPSGSSETGHSGSGMARITYLGTSL